MVTKNKLPGKENFQRFRNLYITDLQVSGWMVGVKKRQILWCASVLVNFSHTPLCQCGPTCQQIKSSVSRVWQYALSRNWGRGVCPFLSSRLLLLSLLPSVYQQRFLRHLLCLLLHRWGVQSNMASSEWLLKKWIAWHIHCIECSLFVA